MSETVAVPSGVFGPHVRTSAAMDKIIPAIFAVQGVLPKPKKEAENTHFHNKYANLESCWDAILKPMQDNGLFVNQFQTRLSKKDGEITMCIAVVHSSGQFINWDVDFPLVKVDPHGVGSAQTYIARYSISRFFGLCPADDDGNAASSHGQGNRNQNGNGQVQQNGQRPPQSQGKQNPAQQKEPTINERFAKAMDAIKKADSDERLLKISDFTGKYNFDEKQRKALSDALTQRRNEIAPPPIESDPGPIPF